MALIHRRTLLAFVALLSLIRPARAFADVPRSPVSQEDTLQAVLDRIHAHAASDDWKKGDFKDDAIEKWVDNLVSKIAKAAEFPELKTPVRLSNVTPLDPKQARISHR